MGNEVTARFADTARMRMDIRTGSGHLVAVDVGPDEGDDTGPTPMELILVSLSGCTAMDVISILRKKRQVPTSYEIHARGERGDAHPRVYTRIVVEHRVDGPVTADAIGRSVELSATKYCPVSAMLSLGTVIEHRYRIGDAGESVLVLLTGPEGAVAA